MEKHNISKENLECGVGLFSTSSRWFRHSDYRVVEGSKGMFYIAPQRTAKVEQYKPFEDFPNILKDFYDLASDIQEIKALWWKEGENEEVAISEKFYIKRERGRSQKLASMLLEFVNCYGPLGLFWQDISDIFPIYKDNRVTNYNIFLKNSLWSNGSRVVPYSEYARSFFPQIKTGFPTYWEDKSSRDRFLRMYHEPVTRVLSSPDFQEVGAHFEKIKEFGGAEANDDDFYKNGNYLTWSRYLKTNMWPIGIELIRENEKWHLRWQFKTLLDALRIMHINNVVGTMKQRVKVCALPDCNVAHLRKGLYCCPRHSNLAAKRSERKREKKAYALYEEGKTPKQVSKMLGVRLETAQKYKNIFTKR